MWELTIFDADEQLVATVDLDGVAREKLCGLCGVDPADPLHFETEVPPDRVAALLSLLGVPAGGGERRYFVGHGERVGLDDQGGDEA